MAWLVWLLALALCAAPATAGVQLDEDTAELARMLRDSCASETGVDLSLVDRVNAGAALSPDAALKCYIKCTMETAGMLSEGEVDVEAVLAMLPPELAAHNAGALRSCGTQRGADECDTAYQTQVCWQNANKEQYFLI